MKKSSSSPTLRNSGKTAVGTSSLSQPDAPDIPKHLTLKNHPFTKKGEKPPQLHSSTGNLHGYMAEDYTQVNWPLPKMFGQEKYAYSLIDFKDGRYTKECGDMSQKLIRLQYDHQIIDLEWRKTYKALLDAEHRQSTLPANCQEKTKTLLKKEVDSTKDRLLELQHQRDLYEENIKQVYSRCDTIKATMKKENDLEDLRKGMEKSTKGKIHENSPFWRTKFNIKTQNARPGQS